MNPLDIHNTLIVYNYIIYTKKINRIFRFIIKFSQKYHLAQTKNGGMYEMYIPPMGIIQYRF